MDGSWKVVSYGLTGHFFIDNHSNSLCGLSRRKAHTFVGKNDWRCKKCVKIYDSDK